MDDVVQREAARRALSAQLGVQLGGQYLGHVIVVATEVGVLVLGREAQLQRVVAVGEGHGGGGLRGDAGVSGHPRLRASWGPANHPGTRAPVARDAAKVSGVGTARRGLPHRPGHPAWLARPLQAAGPGVPGARDAAPPEPPPCAAPLPRPPRLSPRRDPAQPAYPTPRPPRIPKPEPQAFGHSGSPPPPPPRLPPSGKPRQEGHQALEDAWACLHHGSCPPSSCQSPRWSRRGARRGRPGLPQQVLPNPRRPSFSCPVRAGPEPQTFSKVPAGISRAVLVQGEGAPEAQPGCGPARRHPRCLDLGQVPGLWGV
ncbi:hypothetical protein EI555_012993 [Monodon monoceros]|uniref:Uncharacterized protein n=1 Tax=Monodon monoceros TaxID=40151 RepID=A0A4U1F543_MONMO|nr:hypothetical protein EI555_012993 [Monodon monoceros]